MSVQLTWHVRTADVAAPEGDTWQIRTEDTWHHQDATRVSVDLARLAYGWANTEVTRVTTDRVTRGKLTSSDDVAR
jgi:hypothetical protein